LKTTNSFRAVLLTLVLSCASSADAYSRVLQAKTLLRNGHGATEFLTTDWVSVPADNQLRLVAQSSYAVVANIGTKLLKQVGPNQIQQVGLGEILDFATETRKSKEFTLDGGFNYVLAFQGQAVGLPVVIGQAQTKPFTISIRLEDQDGRKILDFGEIPIQYNGRLQLPVPGTSAVQVIDGFLNLSDTLINGALYLKAVPAK